MDTLQIGDTVAIVQNGQVIEVGYSVINTSNRNFLTLQKKNIQYRFDMVQGDLLTKDHIVKAQHCKIEKEYK